MNNEWEEAGKEDIQEDPYKGTDKGKSSHASFAENRVTSHGTVDRNAIIRGQAAPLVTLKSPRVLDKSAKKKAIFG
jgi:hypothetical protein